MTAQRAPAEAADVVTERLEALLADESTIAVVKPAAALLLETDDDDATRAAPADGKVLDPLGCEPTPAVPSVTTEASAAPADGRTLDSLGCEPAPSATRL